MKLIIQIIIFTFIIPTSFSQINIKELKGDWVQYKIERKDGSLIIGNRKNEHRYNEFSFSRNTLQISDNPVTKRHNVIFNINKVTNNKISIGSTTLYVIERLNQDTLILARNFHDKLNSEQNRRYFVRKQLLIDNNKDQYENGYVVLKKYNSPELKVDISKIIEMKLNGDTNFIKLKGVLEFDHSNKTIKTTILESTNDNIKGHNAIIESFNDSYKKWSYKK